MPPRCRLLFSSVPPPRCCLGFSVRPPRCCLNSLSVLGFWCGCRFLGRSGLVWAGQGRSGLVWAGPAGRPGGFGENIRETLWSTKHGKKTGRPAGGLRPKRERGGGAKSEAKQKLKPNVDSTPTDTYGSKFPQGRPRELFETTETQSLSRCVPEPVASLAVESKRSNVLNGTDQKPRRSLIYGGRVCFRASIMWRSFESF